MIVFARHTLHLPGYRTIYAGTPLDTADPAYKGREGCFETGEDLQARVTGTARPERPVEEEAARFGGAKTPRRAKGTR